MTQLTLLGEEKPKGRETYRIIRIVGRVLEVKPTFDAGHVEDYSEDGLEYNLHEAVGVANELALTTGCPVWVLAEALNDLVAYRVAPTDYRGPSAAQ